MYQIDARFHCPNRFCEVCSDDVASTELIVEEFISLALLSLFESVSIENVSVSFALDSAHENEQILIAVQAQGYDPLPSTNVAHLDGMIEDRLSCALLELFGLLNVERCAIV